MNKKSMLRSIVAVWLATASALVSPAAPTASAAQRGGTCEESLGVLVMLQGRVETRRSGDARWEPAQLEDLFCPGDMIRVRGRSRASVYLKEESPLNLDENTTLTFLGPEQEGLTLIEILKGAAHFFSRQPRSLKVITAFVNGVVEGTEFFVRVEDARTLITVFEGRVSASNESGSLFLAAGESAVAKKDAAPAVRMVVRPRDAVQWALYYPALYTWRAEDFAGDGDGGWHARVRDSIAFAGEGNLPGAFSSLEGIPEDVGDPRFFIYRASLLLGVGRVDESRADIERALSLDPRSSHSLALQSVIAVVQNEREEGLELALRAVELDRASASAWMALSYARQAIFDLAGALESLRQAVSIRPGDALALARLAELQLSTGDLDGAVDSAQQAVEISPRSSRARSILGFSHLVRLNTRAAKDAFMKAIALDPASPLPRLGLGLARIREGDLRGGRREIEIAAGLDSGLSIIRSYLGKAYFDEKRDTDAQRQFTVAVELDPLDPTPWLYEAIRKQSVNRPVEALYDLRKSVALNDNRAVYRSRLLLDDDLAARSASLARVYRDLGFQQLALLEGWRSVEAEPGNYSAHRFLADSYSALPRHEVARISELHQSQLLQPISVTPVQPQLAEGGLFILEGAGPAEPAFNEFNALFFRNRLALQASGVAGGNDTLGDEITLSGVQGRGSFSVGQFHYETEGFRENNDLRQDIYSAFAQVRLSHKTSVLGEVRLNESERGDLALTFTDFYIDTLRQEEDLSSVRVGARHAFSSRSEVIASYLFRSADLLTDVSPGFLKLESDVEAHFGEVRFLTSVGRSSLTGGGSYSRVQDTTVTTFQGLPSSDEIDSEHAGVYIYSQMRLPQEVTLTLGGSADFLDGATSDEDRDQFNPKLGLTWNPVPATTLRAALFRTLRRPTVSRLNTEATLEPTQVAGFNQFFADAEGDAAWRYGLAVDQTFSPKLHGGAEWSARDLDVVFFNVPGLVPAVTRRDWKEQIARAYLYWTPHPRISLSGELLYEWFDRDTTGDLAGVEQFTELQTLRVPIGVRYFHPCGFKAAFTATYVDQDGDFTVPDDFGDVVIVPGEDQFWVVDASIGYRLPKRYGIVTLEAKNLFDEEFNFQDTDPANPRIIPDRLILLSLTVSF